MKDTTITSDTTTITSDIIMNDAMAKLRALDGHCENSSRLISVIPAKDYITQGKAMEKPRELYEHILVEKELTILFGDTGLGKTTLAFQIAINLAEQGMKVIYFNFELSQAQFAAKYPDRAIPDGLLIACVDFSQMEDVTDQAKIIEEIEQLSVENRAEVIIIDNLTNLCLNAQDGSEAGAVMLKLLKLRMTHQWTMLVLAHVPKRKLSDPITLNDLAGSKILSNIADNVAAINRSKIGPCTRYLIQLKYRSFEIKLNYQNVLSLTIGMFDGFLSFKKGDFDEERKHLPNTRDEKAEQEMDIINIIKKNPTISYRDIANELGVSLGFVHRTLKANGIRRKQKD